MSNALLTLLAILWLGWLLYVLTMGMYRAWLTGRLVGLSLLLSSPVVVFAVALDVLANLLLAPLLFADLPREWLVTHRLVRYIRTDSGWRRRVAVFVCDHLLDVFDPTGDHC